MDFDSKAYQFSSMARAEDLFVLISNPKERDSFVVLAEDPVIDHTLYSPAAHPEQYFSKCCLNIGEERDYIVNQPQRKETRSRL